MNPNKTQDKILIYLKMNGSQSASTLAKQFGMTGEGMRLHLVKLEEEGLILSESFVKGVGRPTILFRLTEKGSKRFPDNHASLTIQLLDNIHHVLGQEALDRVIKAKQETDYLRYENELKEAKDTEEKLALFTSIRTREGYMAELEKNELGWLFIENHCPICSAAIHCNGFCRSEIENIQKLLGDALTIEREDHTASGDRRCVYRIY
jgi:predicted ArsR family transcriptional regulator